MSKYEFNSFAASSKGRSNSKYQLNDDLDDSMSLVDLDLSLTESLSHSQVSNSTKTTSKDAADLTSSKPSSAKRKLAMSQSITSLSEEAVARNESKKKSRKDADDDGDDVQEDEEVPELDLDKTPSTVSGEKVSPLSKQTRFKRLCPLK